VYLVRRRPLGLASAVVMAVSILGGVPESAVAAPGDDLSLAREPSVPARPVRVPDAEPGIVEQRALRTIPTVSWPKPGAAEVTLEPDGAGRKEAARSAVRTARTKAGGLPVAVGAPRDDAGTAAPGRVRIELLPRQQDRLLLRVRRTDGVAATGRVGVLAEGVRRRQPSGTRLEHQALPPGAVDAGRAGRRTRGLVQQVRGHPGDRGGPHHRPAADGDPDRVTGHAGVAVRRRRRPGGGEPQDLVAVARIRPGPYPQGRSRRRHQCDRVAVLPRHGRRPHRVRRPEGSCLPRLDRQAGSGRRSAGRHRAGEHHVRRRRHGTGEGGHLLRVGFQLVYTDQYGEGHPPDPEQMDEWMDSRDGDDEHPYTSVLRGAVTPRKIKVDRYGNITLGGQPAD